MGNIKMKNLNNMSYPSLKKQFLFFKKAQGLADRTMKDYNTTFRGFEKYYNKDRVDIEEMKNAILEMFEKLSNGAPATFNVPYSNLMCFFNWCTTNKFLGDNPLRLTGLKKKRDEGRARTIPEDIIVRLFEIMELDTFVGFRDYVILILTLDTGIRPSEAFSLELEDIDLEHYEVTVKAISAKTRILRILPISYQTVEILRKFLMIREDDWLKYLFLTIRGTQMTTNAWDIRMQKYREKLKYNFTPYDLRHSFAIYFIKNRRRPICIAENVRTY